MLLQLSSHQPKVSLSSTLYYSQPLPCKVSTFTLPQTVNFQRLSVTCSISKIHSYGTVDYERRPIVKWNDIYRRISLMKNPELGSASSLKQWENEGKKALTKWELCRVVKELRKYKRHDRALEVYEWMSNRGNRYRLSESDAAVQLDLIAKVHGVSSAEEYFLTLTDKIKGKKTYGALLNAYVQVKLNDKAESLLDTMRSKGYATHALPFNVMMTLYMNLKEYDKVDLMVSEMIEKNIQLDIYSYHIWLSSSGSEGSTEKMERVFEQMTKDKTVVPNWTTFSTMASMYIKMGQLEKAEECLRKLESRITGRDRIPYHFLLRLYGNVNKKEEVYRVWNTYKSIFPSVPNLGYHAFISSLVKTGDIEGAEKHYKEWLSVKSSFDPRIPNLLIRWYFRNGNADKALGIYNHMIEVGGIPNSNTWQLLADVHIGEKRVSEALSCFREACKADTFKSWRPMPVTVSAFFNLCQDKDDLESSQALAGLLRQSGYIKDEAYASLIGLSDGAIGTGNSFSQIETTDITDENSENENMDDGSQILFNELEGSL